MRGEDWSDAVPAHLARLLDAAVASLSGTRGVRGVFLGGSVAAGRADRSSDLDLRALVDDARLDALVARRRELPAAWGELLFTECADGTRHCVSHFAGFAKVDVFYIGVGRFVPARWLSGPVRAPHDPDGLLREGIDALRQGPVEPTEVSAEGIERDVSKELATAAEGVRRRGRRGEALGEHGRLGPQLPERGVALGNGGAERVGAALQLAERGAAGLLGSLGRGARLGERGVAHGRLALGRDAGLALGVERVGGEVRVDGAALGDGVGEVGRQRDHLAARVFALERRGRGVVARALGAALGRGLEQPDVGGAGRRPAGVDEPLRAPARCGAAR